MRVTYNAKQHTHTNTMFRTPKHHSVHAEANKASHENEPEVRVGAIPPTDYDDKAPSTWETAKSWKANSKARKAWGK